MMIQLKPPIPFRTSKGNGLAHVLIDYGIEYDLLWITIMDDTGEVWTLNNSEVRGYKNVSYGVSRGEN